MNYNMINILNYIFANGLRAKKKQTNKQKKRSEADELGKRGKQGGSRRAVERQENCIIEHSHKHDYTHTHTHSLPYV